MRTAFISMCVVLVAALSVCFMSMMLHRAMLNEMLGMCDSASAMLKDDDVSGAEAEIERIEARFERGLPVLELVAHHDTLHEALAAITDAEVAFECGDVDDVHQALARLVGTLEHLLNHEELSFANLT